MSENMSEVHYLEIQWGRCGLGVLVWLMCSLTGCNYCVHNAQTNHLRGGKLQVLEQSADCENALSFMSASATDEICFTLRWQTLVIKTGVKDEPSKVWQDG